MPFAVGIALFAIGLDHRRPRAVDGGARRRRASCRASAPGTVPPIAYVAIGRSLPERLRPQMFATLSTAWVLPGPAGTGDRRGGRRVLRVALRVPGPAAADRDLVRHRLPAGAAGRTGRRPRPTAAATLRRRLPLALVVAAGTGLLLARPDQRAAGRCSSCSGRSGRRSRSSALRRLTPPGTLLAARGLPAAVLDPRDHHVRVLRGRRVHRAGPRRTGAGSARPKPASA